MIKKLKIHKMRETAITKTKAEKNLNIYIYIYFFFLICNWEIVHKWKVNLNPSVEEGVHISLQ